MRVRLQTDGIDLDVEFGVPADLDAILAIVANRLLGDGGVPAPATATSQPLVAVAVADPAPPRTPSLPIETGFAHARRTAVAEWMRQQPRPVRQREIRAQFTDAFPTDQALWHFLNTWSTRPDCPLAKVGHGYWRHRDCPPGGKEAAAADHGVARFPVGADRDGRATG